LARRAPCPLTGNCPRRPWKALLGVGAACAACCAIPLVGGVTVLATGSAELAATGAALMACADEFIPLAVVVLGLGLAGIGVWFIRVLCGSNLPQSAGVRGQEALPRSGAVSS